MRNPFRSALSRSWIEAATAKLRGSSERLGAAVEGLKLKHKWMIGVLVCAVAICSISLMASGRSSKKGGTSGVTSREAAKAETAAAKAETTHAAASAPAPKEPKEKSGEKAAGSEKNGEAAKEPAAAAGQERAFQKAPAATKGNAEPVEEEDNVRARAQWFHDQRAYPFKYIPSGGLTGPRRWLEAPKNLRSSSSQGFEKDSLVRSLAADWTGKHPLAM